MEILPTSIEYNTPSATTFENAKNPADATDITSTGVIPQAININEVNTPKSFTDLAQPDKANNLDAGRDNTMSTSTSQTVSYTMLEPINNSKTVGIGPTAFADYIQTSFNVLFGVFIVWSVFRIAYGGVLFMTSDIINKKIAGKEMVVTSLKYIVLSMITYTTMFVINPDILNNKVTNIIKDGVVAVGQGVGNAVSGAVSGGTPSIIGGKCDNPALVIEKIKTAKDICSSTVCSKTCQFSSEIISIAKSEAQKANIDYRIVLALACRESSGNPSAIGNHANNGYPDCGLMQINMKGKGSSSCTADIMNLENNIKEGVSLYKGKLSTTRNYGNVSVASQAFASYNCCAGGENPNDTSVSCNSTTGFDAPIPKWACPLDPGSAAFNMCNVKNYACDVTACISKY